MLRFAQHDINATVYVMNFSYRTLEYSSRIEFEIQNQLTRTAFSSTNSSLHTLR
jgi:hypothetical protein